MDHIFTRLAERMAWIAGRPVAFCTAIVFVLAWSFAGPWFGFSEKWQLVVNTSTTIITFLMVFLIQNSQNRDIIALHSKLDELIRAVETARNDLIGVERLPDAELEAIRIKLEDEAREQPGEPGLRQVQQSEIDREVELVRG